jgi:hypothetical protein
MGTWLLFLATAALWWVTYRLWRTTVGTIADERRSVEVAEASLEHARLASQQELRAWVQLRAALKDCKRSPKGAHVTIAASLENVGKTPALRVAVSVRCYVRPSLVQNYGELPMAEKYPHPTPSLLPGEEDMQPGFGIQISAAELEAGVSAARAARFQPMIVVDVIAYYHTIFDAETDPKRMTSVRHNLHPRMSQDADFEARMRWLDEIGPAAVDQVLFAQDRSAPTYLS